MAITRHNPSAFASYSTLDRHIAAEVKRLLEDYEISCFLAHEDIEISQQWRDRILRELLQCQIFVPLISKSFKESDWAPQEIGVISARNDIVVIPLSIDGTMPFGFISHIQGKRIDAPDSLKDLLIVSLAKNHPHLVIPGMIKRVENAGTFRSAESAMQPLVSLFAELTGEELGALVNASIKNGQVWDASLCKTDYLPKLIETRGRDIDPTTLDDLKNKIAR